MVERDETAQSAGEPPVGEPPVGEPPGGRRYGLPGKLGLLGSLLVILLIAVAFLAQLVAGECPVP